MSPLRLAVISTFYPNPSAPYRTPFVGHLVRALAQQADVRVLAPLPYAPPWPPLRRWRALRAVPAEHEDGPLRIGHPRYVVIPKVDALSGFTYARAVLPWLRRMRAERPIDVLHAHCAYPDGVGVALSARELGIPLVVTAHGSDLNLDARRVSLRGQMRWALRHAAGVIAVSEDLRRKAIELAPEAQERISCIPCAGVDTAVFHHGDRLAARAARSLAPGSRVALFVGNLVAIKALDVLLAAWRLLLEAGTVGDADRLILIGDGVLRQQLSTDTRAQALRGTVRLLGALPQREVAGWMQAASVLCLSSRQEGMPNVVIEALASGLPVAATAVGGIPDLVKPHVNGYLAAPGDARQLAQALGEALGRNWDAAQIAAGAAGYNWRDLATRNLEVLSSAAERPAIK
ncbi:MAG TPA: glycosyltransferase [Candidatus Dormibacteraeota bacterium]|nr:glycosyltransferase [Candidatus Dormibacteraeota bacterium]